MKNRIHPLRRNKLPFIAAVISLGLLTSTQSFALSMPSPFKKIADKFHKGDNFDGSAAEGNDALADLDPADAVPAPSGIMRSAPQAGITTFPAAPGIDPTPVKSPSDYRWKMNTPYAKGPAGLMERGVAKLVPHLYRPVHSYAPVLSENDRSYVTSILQPGDVLVDTNDREPGWIMFEAAMGRSPSWDHAALYIGNGTVVEAGGLDNPTNVHELPLEQFLDTNQLAVVRPGYQTQEDRQAAVNYALSVLGRPYDSRFDMIPEKGLHPFKKIMMGDAEAGRSLDDQDLFCSELVANALYKGGIGRIVTSGRLGGLEGRLVSPEDLVRSTQIDAPQLTLIWSNGSGFWKNLVGSRFPHKI